MIKHILVALDGSKHGQVALEQSVVLAQQLGARLHGVHVLDSSMLRSSLLHDFSGSVGLEPQLHLRSQLEGFMKTVADSLLQNFKLRCAAAGVVGHAEVVMATVAEGLIEAAHRADLVVLGRHGSAYDLAPNDHGQGSTARQLIRQSPTSLFVTGTEVRAMQKILVGMDGSPGSWKALKGAVALSRELKVGLEVAQVTPIGSPERPEVLTQAQTYAEGYGVTAHYHSRRGDPVVVLLELLQQTGADLLAVGYEGGSRLREFFIGHTPDALMTRVTQRLWVAH